MFKEKAELLKYVESENLSLSDRKNCEVTEIFLHLENQILNYLQGYNINLLDEIKRKNIELDLESKFKTDFSRKVVGELIKLNRGEVTTYYEIGRKINSTAFRAIGNVCKSNPIPLIIPCHRVIRKNGEIGGFMGKSDRRWETAIKKQLLTIEGYYKLKAELE